MKLKNSEIYNYAKKLINFNNNEQWPVTINFYILKNIQNIIDSAVAIEKTMQFISKKYGKIIDEESQTYKIEPQNMDIAQKELDELSDIVQEVDIKKIKLSDISTLQMNSEQLNAILFMIEDDLNETKEDK